MTRARLALAAALMAASPAFAGPVTDLAAKAEAAMAGDPLAALSALDEAVEAVWSASPLLFRKALFVDSASGFGIYAERANAVFKPGEPIIIYSEPVGFGYGKNAVGGLEINLVADFVLTSDSGEELFKKDEFFASEQPVRYHNREFLMTITLNLTGLPAGKYVGKFKVRDKHSDKTGEFELAFEVAG